MGELFFFFFYVVTKIYGNNTENRTSEEPWDVLSQIYNALSMLDGLYKSLFGPNVTVGKERELNKSMVIYLVTVCSFFAHNRNMDHVEKMSCEHLQI